MSFVVLEFSFPSKLTILYLPVFLPVFFPLSYMATNIMIMGLVANVILIANSICNSSDVSFVTLQQQHWSFLYLDSSLLVLLLLFLLPILFLLMLLNWLKLVIINQLQYSWTDSGSFQQNSSYKVEILAKIISLLADN